MWLITMKSLSISSMSEKSTILFLWMANHNTSFPRDLSHPTKKNKWGGLMVTVLDSGSVFYSYQFDVLWRQFLFLTVAQKVAK